MIDHALHPYIPPDPRPCSACGADVVHEFGMFDAVSYAAGVLQRHLCAFSAPTAGILSEREFIAHLTQCPECSQRWQAPSKMTAPKAKPAPKPVQEPIAKRVSAKAEGIGIE